MRTTITLDDDVVAIIDRERRRRGETTRQTVNRLIRSTTHRSTPPPELPIVPGNLLVDIADVSAVLADLDDIPGVGG